MSDLINLAGKKLLILGGNPETGILVDTANNLGIYTIVIDPNPESPAKQFAKKYYNIDGFDIPNLSKVAKDEKVDGILVGVADILVKPYFELCEKLELPCYATNNIINALTTKDAFMEACNRYGIQTIPCFNLDKNFNVEDLIKIKYPVMVKPVDNGGGVGMSICNNQDELIQGSKNAINNSRKKFTSEDKKRLEKLYNKRSWYKLNDYYEKIIDKQPVSKRKKNNNTITLRKKRKLKDHLIE